MGGSGIVEEWSYLNSRVAVKHYKPDAGKTIEREFGVLTRLHFPYLPRLLGWSNIGEKTCIVLEVYSRATLWDFLKSQKQKGVEMLMHSKRWALQIWAALQYLHSRSPTLAHGDVHPRNVLFSMEPGNNLDQLNVVLIDFDFSASEGWRPEQLSKVSLFPRFANRNILQKEDYCALDILLFGFFLIMVGTLLIGEILLIILSVAEQYDLGLPWAAKGYEAK